MYIRNQRGTSLVEAAVALLLVGLISKGAVHLTTRATAVQGDLHLLEIAVNQLRSILIENESICADSLVSTLSISLPGSPSLDVAVQGCDSTTTAMINGVLVSGVPKPIALSANSAILGGQVVVGGTWIQ